jgi:hypothetical protein
MQGKAHRLLELYILSFESRILACLVAVVSCKRSFFVFLF